MAGSRIPTAERSPQLQSDLRFVSATNEVAQHPSAGVAVVGATEMRHIQRGKLRPAQVIAPRMVGVRAERMVEITAATHRLVGAYGLATESLRKTVPFAYDGLVMGSIISAAVEMDMGRSGKALPNIDVVTPEQAGHFVAAFDRYGRRVQQLGSVLGGIAAALTRPDGAAQDSIDTYHDNLLAISAKYADKRGDPARFGELDVVRTELGRALIPIVDRAILDSEAGLTSVQADVLSHNVLRSTPAPGLLHAHFGAPPGA